MQQPYHRTRNIDMPVPMLAELHVQDMLRRAADERLARVARDAADPVHPVAASWRRGIAAMIRSRFSAFFRLVPAGFLFARIGRAGGTAAPSAVGGEGE